MKDSPARDIDDPRYIPHELLLTYTGPDILAQDDVRLERLHGMARMIVDGESIEHAREHARMQEQLDALQPGRSGIQATAQKGGGQRPHLPMTRRLLLTPRRPSPNERDHVKAAVDRINGNLDGLRHGDVAIVSAMPNWILSSSVGGPHNGPATIAGPIARKGTWAFSRPEVAGSWQQLGQSTGGENVVVAVLDTWPGQESLDWAANLDNEVMKTIYRMVDDRRIEVIDPPAGAAPVPPRHTYAELDHGLFVTSIIHRIAPSACFKVFHILNEYGLGSTDRLLSALKSCVELAHDCKGQGKRLVVNMSLYLLIPPDDAPESLWDVWFAHHPEDSALAAQDRASLVDKLALGVEHYVDLLLDAGAVVIAAAGNDALAYASAGHPDHLQPRMPADYDKVVCVVAANREGKIAEYSNRADVPMKGNCIATWGGEGVVSASPDNRGTVVVPANDDGVVGLFTRRGTVMNEENTTGWVYWSGTSFAAPIISGLAAVLLGDDPLLTQRAVMARLYGMAQPSAETDPALGCPYIRVVQRA
jgi:hypothetical protein